MGKEDLRVLGVDLGGSSVKMGLLDPERGLVDVRKADTIVGDPEAMVSLMCDIAAGYDPDIIGVGSAGGINHKTGLVGAGNLKWREVPLRRMLEDRLGRPVWVDNDAQAALMAEAYNGVIAGANCAVYMTLGTGVGGALLIEGKPWRGGDNTAFELGHMITRAGGVKCMCGRLGCYESYASSGALSRYAGGKPERAVIDGVIAGDPEALKAFDIYLYELCVGIVSVINLFRPEVIALGGGVSAAGAALVDGAERILEERFMISQDKVTTKIKLAVHKNDAGMIGAAALARLHLIK